MTIVICPGVHDPAFTQEFLAGLHQINSVAKCLKQPPLIFPAHQAAPFSGLEVGEFLRRRCVPDVPILMICFSAGVVGGITAAWAWQAGGGKVAGFLALDGWGVPLGGSFPIHRLSHDYFTHWSSSLLGAGDDSFYAEPEIEHLELWRSPHIAQGWWMKNNQRQATTAAQFINGLLERYSSPLKSVESLDQG